MPNHNNPRALRAYALSHMAVSIKTPDEVDLMRVAGQLAASVLHMIRPDVKPGATTGELDRICHNYITNELDAFRDAWPGPHGFATPPCWGSFAVQTNNVGLRLP